MLSISLPRALGTVLAVGCRPFAGMKFLFHVVKYKDRDNWCLDSCAGISCFGAGTDFPNGKISCFGAGTSACLILHKAHTMEGTDHSNGTMSDPKPSLELDGRLFEGSMQEEEGIPSKRARRDHMYNQEELDIAALFPKLGEVINENAYRIAGFLDTETLLQKARISKPFLKAVFQEFFVRQLKASVAPKSIIKQLKVVRSFPLKSANLDGPSAFTSGPTNSGFPTEHAGSMMVHLPNDNVAMLDTTAMKNTRTMQLKVLDTSSLQVLAESQLEFPALTGSVGDYVMFMFMLGPFLAGITSTGCRTLIHLWNAHNNYTSFCFRCAKDLTCTGLIVDDLMVTKDTQRLYVLYNHFAPLANRWRKINKSLAAPPFIDDNPEEMNFMLAEFTAAWLCTYTTDVFPKPSLSTWFKLPGRQCSRRQFHRNNNSLFASGDFIMMVHSCCIPSTTSVQVFRRSTLHITETLVSVLFDGHYLPIYAELMPPRPL